MVSHNGKRYRVADAHAHVYPGKIAEKATAAVGKFYDIDMNNVGIPHVLHEAGTMAGIEKFLISSVATKVEQVRAITDFIATKCEVYPTFVGLGAWHQDITDIDAEFDHIQELGLKGIKLHPDFQRFNIDDEKMLDVYKEANRRGLPVLFHTGDDRTDFSSPARLAKVIDKIPEFTCVAAHFGGYRRWDESRMLLSGANVYIDTSSSLAFIDNELARENIRHFGVERTLFGTDFPMWHPEEELERYFAMGLSYEENKQILWENFAKLYNLE